MTEGEEHSYPGINDQGFQFTSDCEYGCGCWMGGSRSGGPDGVNPFGYCPKAPKPAKGVIKKDLAPERIAQIRQAPHGPDVDATLDEIEVNREWMVHANDLRLEVDRLQNLICRQAAQLEAQASALAHWRREADRDAGRIARLTAENAKAVTELRETLSHYKWRPIADIHEDYGPCVLMRIEDPGYLEIGSNLDTGFDESQWTHFAEVPKLSHDEAEGLIADMINKD